MKIKSTFPYRYYFCFCLIIFAFNVVALPSFFVVAEGYLAGFTTPIVGFGAIALFLINIILCILFTVFMILKRKLIKE